MNRLLSEIRSDAGNRLVALYGPGAGDRFITPDVREIPLDQALYECLRSQGYDRIAFWSPSRQFFFLDEGSRGHLRPPGAVTKQRTGALKAGPMGRTSMLGQRLTPSPVGSAMGPLRALELMRWFMQDEQSRGALVLLQAEDFFTDNDQRKLLSAHFVWEQLPSTNKNVCFLVFVGLTSREEIASAVEGWRIPALVRMVQPTAKLQALVRIAGPDFEELRLAVDYSRLRFGLEVDWRQRARLTRSLEAEGLPLSHWMNLFTNGGRLGPATVAGWTSAPFDDSGLSAWERLNGMQGLTSVKIALEKRLKAAEQARKEGTSRHSMFHMIFSGNPGTGKTSVARLVGEILREMGVLSRGHCVPVRYENLVSPFIDNTPQTTRALVERAIDGVLFIDEAHRFAEGDEHSHGPEAISTLVPILEDMRHRLVVILAGYSDGMEKVLALDPGMPRRFPKRLRFEFEDFSPEELKNIFERELGERGLKFDVAFGQHITHICNYLYETRTHTSGNAGQIRTLVEELEENYFNRASDMGTMSRQLILEDLSEELQEVAKNQQTIQRTHPEDAVQAAPRFGHLEI